MNTILVWLIAVALFLVLACVGVGLTIFTWYLIDLVFKGD